MICAGVPVCVSVGQCVALTCVCMCLYVCLCVFVCFCTCFCVCVCVLTSCTSSCIELRYRRGRPRCSPVHCINCLDDHMKMIDRDARLRTNADPKVVKSHHFYDQFYIWRIGSLLSMVDRLGHT